MKFGQIQGDALSLLQAVMSPQAIYVQRYAGESEKHENAPTTLLVIVADSALGPYERDAVACRALRGIPIPIDVVVYTQQEFDERAALKTSFERSVKQKGALIHAA